MLGHPTGRIIGQRDPSGFDLARVLEVAREEGVAMEINSMPERLDLSDKAARQAKDAGVRLVISTDAHHASQLANLRYGVWVARSAWLEARDILNTRPRAQLRRATARHHC